MTMMAARAVLAHVRVACLACAGFILVPVLAADPGPKPAVAALFEDDAEGLLKLLTNPTGDPGEGRVEGDVVFSGARSIKIIPMQRFHSRVPGWQYRIVEKPGPG